MMAMHDSIIRRCQVVAKTATTIVAIFIVAPSAQLTLRRVNMTDSSCTSSGFVSCDAHAIALEAGATLDAALLTLEIACDASLDHPFLDGAAAAAVRGLQVIAMPGWDVSAASLAERIASNASALPGCEHDSCGVAAACSLASPLVQQPSHRHLVNRTALVVSNGGVRRPRFDFFGFLPRRRG